MNNIDNVTKSSNLTIYQSLDKFEQSAQAFGRKFKQIVQPNPLTQAQTLSVADHFEFHAMGNQLDREAKGIKREINFIPNPLAQIAAEIRYGLIMGELSRKVQEVGLAAIRQNQRETKEKLELISKSKDQISIADTFEFRMQLNQLEVASALYSYTKRLVRSLV